MSTTIRVKRRTLKLLEREKRRLSLRTYDEVIRRLIREELGVKDDLFGVDRGRISSFSEKNRLEDRV